MQFFVNRLQAASACKPKESILQDSHMLVCSDRLVHGLYDLLRKSITLFRIDLIEIRFGQRFFILLTNRKQILMSE